MKTPINLLISLTQEQLAHIQFPLGNLRKTEVRKAAGECHFVNASKPDSQDICFVPDGNYTAFLERETGKKYQQGNFVDNEGNILGRHKGIVSYTIGQRKGLGIALGKPVYVTGINVENNTVTLGSEKELFFREFIVNDFNWISGTVPYSVIHCNVKIRYRQKEQPAKAIPLSDGRVKITYNEPQRAITPGQAAVLYDGDIVLGGGVIETLCGV